ERRWALALLEHALERLRGEFDADDKSDLFQVLRQFQGDEATPRTYAEAAAQLGMNENTLKSHVLRFRRRYRELIWREVAQTVSAPGDVEDELRHLKRILAT